MAFVDTLDALLKKRADQITFGYIGKTKPITPRNGTYLTITVETLHIKDVRRVTGKFYGAMYGSISVPYKNGECREFQAIDSVSQLKELDADHLDRIIPGPFCLLDDVPYYNTGIDVGVSLLSVKSADLAAPYINLLKTIADAAGVAFLSQMAPFTEVIEKGISELISDNTIEIGRYGNFRPVYEGVYVVIRTNKERLPLDKLEYDAKLQCLRFNGAELTDYPYFVLKFSSSKRRENWCQIPEIKAAYQDFVEQLRKTPENYSVNLQAFSTFKHVVDLSPELLGKDADRLIEKIRMEFLKNLTAKPAIEKTGEISNGREIKIGKSFTEAIGQPLKTRAVKPAFKMAYGGKQLLQDHPAPTVVVDSFAALPLNMELKDFDPFDASV